VEGADFGRFESHVREWGVVGRGLCISGRNERLAVFLITVFQKNEKENLSMAERNTLKKRADSIFETHGR